MSIFYTDLVSYVFISDLLLVCIYLKESPSEVVRNPFLCVNTTLY